MYAMLVEIDYRALGLVISKYRHIARLSQESLAELVGLSPKFIGNIERGASKLSVKTLLSISVALNLPLSDLLDPSIIRIIEDSNENKLRDAASGFANTLTAQLLNEQICEDSDDCPFPFGILEIDDSYFTR